MASRDASRKEKGELFMNRITIYMYMSVYCPTGHITGPLHAILHNNQYNMVSVILHIQFQKKGSIPKWSDK